VLYVLNVTLSVIALYITVLGQLGRGLNPSSTGTMRIYKKINMLGVVMLSVIMLNVVAPLSKLSPFFKWAGGLTFYALFYLFISTFIFRLLL
jgi:hypothetical protein